MLFILMFQSTFQTVQLTAAAEIDTYNPQIYVIEENTVTVSAHTPPCGSWSLAGIPFLTVYGTLILLTYLYIELSQ